MTKEEYSEIELVREFMLRMKAYFPMDSSGYACMFCDMGGAGCSAMGPGTHDNKCPYRTIQLYEEIYGKIKDEK